MALEPTSQKSSPKGEAIQSSGKPEIAVTCISGWVKGMCRSEEAEGGLTDAEETRVQTALRDDVVAYLHWLRRCECKDDCQYTAL